MSWDIGIDLYTLLCTEQVTIENLLNSMGNSTQCSMVTQMGEESNNILKLICSVLNLYLDFSQEEMDQQTLKLNCLTATTVMLAVFQIRWTDNEYSLKPPQIIS